MPTQKLTVQTTVVAPIDRVWAAYISPEDIKQWNAATADWHTPSASVDFREGGRFNWRMEAKDGSVGFDFAGTYTKIESNSLIEFDMGERQTTVRFVPEQYGVRVSITFDAELEHSIEQQRTGWQAILDSFKRHVEK